MKHTGSSISSNLVWLPYSVAIVLAGLGTTHGAGYPETVLADNPAAYYRLEETDVSAAAKDSSASGAYPGAYVSEDPLFPKLGQPGIDTNSVYFRSYDNNGPVYSYVEIPNSPDLNPPGAFSAEAWVRPMSVATDGSYRAAVCSFGGWITDSPGWLFYQSPETAASPSAWIWVMKGGGIWIQSGPVKKYTWQHLAASFDGTKVTFYVDGQSIGNANVPGYVPNSSQPTYIGSGRSGAWMFDGNVDEVAIYTNALTADQIALHYQVGLTNFRVGQLPAVITQDPSPATQFAGRSVQFSVGADGTAPLSYQWYKGAAAIPGATDDKLTFICARADDGALYKAVVTNLYGSATSATAQLTVATDLTLASGPAAITRNVGSVAAFRAVAGGALPFTYQWYKGSTAITGATNDVLWLANVQAADDASSYYAKINNPWNTTNTDPAILTVVPRSVTVPVNRYAKVVMADSPVAYWRLDEGDVNTAAVDAAGSFDGAFDPLGAGNYTSGAFAFGVDTGIPYETNKAVSVTGGARIAVPWALELNPQGPFTAEAWFKPASVGADDLDYRTAFSSEGSGPSGWLLYQQPNRTWAWVVYGGDWSTTSFITDTQDTIEANNWYHVVLAFDGDVFNVYVNGQLGVSQQWGAYYVANRDGKVNFGWRSLNDWKPYDGVIDDVAFYNKALTLDQVQAHFHATVRLSVATQGDKIVMSWPFGALQQSSALNGPYTDVTGATSPYTNSLSSGTSFFRVKAYSVP